MKVSTACAGYLAFASYVGETWVCLGLPRNALLLMTPHCYLSLRLKGVCRFRGDSMHPGAG